MAVERVPFLKFENRVEEKAPVYDLEGKVVKEVELPTVFFTAFREDLIRKVFLALRTSRLQPKGVDPLAGKRTTAESWGVGYGMARVPRVKGSTRVAFVPQAVGGRRVGAPTVMKRIKERVNRLEKKRALAAAIAATAIREVVVKRGHKVSENITLPIIVTNDIEKVSKTRDIRSFLKKISLWDDVERARKGVRIRSGKGKMRGRRYKIPKSILFVVAKRSELYKAARNLVGVDVVSVKKLNVEHLAPGGHPGRLTIWSENAIKALKEIFGD